MSAASDEVHDLDPVAVGERGPSIGRARHDLQIALDGHLAPVEAQGRDEAGDVGQALEGPGFSVDGQLHRRGLWKVAKLVTRSPDRYKTPESTAEPNVETDLCAERPQSQPPGDPRAGDLRTSDPGRRAQAVRGARVGLGAAGRVPAVEPRGRADRLDPGGPHRGLGGGD